MGVASCVPETIVTFAVPGWKVTLATRIGESAVHELLVCTLLAGAISLVARTTGTATFGAVRIGVGGSGADTNGDSGIVVSDTLIAADGARSVGVVLADGTAGVGAAGG